MSIAQNISNSGLDEIKVAVYDQSCNICAQTRDSVKAVYNNIISGDHDDASAAEVNQIYQRVMSEHDSLSKLVNIINTAKEYYAEAESQLANKMQLNSLHIDKCAIIGSLIAATSLTAWQINKLIGNASITTEGGTSDYPNMKKYGDRFQVVEGFEEKYCQKQSNTTRESGNCTSTATAIAQTIEQNNGGVITPGDEDWNVWKDEKGNWQGGATFDGTLDVGGYIGLTDEKDKLKIIADQLTKGNAVIVRANESHTVTAIGIKSGVDINKLSPKDILIVDPYTGKVTTLDNAKLGCTLPTSDKGVNKLRIACYSPMKWRKMLQSL